MVVPLLVVMAFSVWSYDDGQQYVGSWVALTILLAPSVLFNFSTFLLLSCSPQLTRSSSSLLVRILCLEDTLYALCCLVSCALNLHHSSIYGEHVGCEVQAMYMMFFELCTGYTLCCVAYNSERKVAGKRGLTQRQVWIAHAVFWAVAALITVLSAVVVQPARVFPSGTFCLVAINEVGPALLFWLPGLAVILGAITYRYALLYHYISQRSTLLADQYAKTPAATAAQMRQIAAAKRMAAIVASFLLSNLPFAVLGLYELCSRQDAPPVLTIGAAWLIHLGSMLNPIIYVWLNSKIRTAVSDAVRRMMMSTATVTPLLMGRQASVLTDPSSTPPSQSSPPTRRKDSALSPPVAASMLTTNTTLTHTPLTIITQLPLPSPPLTAAAPTTPPLPPARTTVTSPQLTASSKRRASAVQLLVVDGGHARPGSSTVVGQDGVANYPSQYSIRQPTAEMDSSGGALSPLRESRAEQSAMDVSSMA